ncbi:MAG TPA: hypothetical protein VM713_10480, partial [Steroidobacteraceae bacterium]|nr:hypothetical protein [Steroidobacteraceae bacterium]
MHPNDPGLRSFADVPGDSPFPIQNLPYGMFSTPNHAASRAGVAIGDYVLDLAALENAGLLRIVPGGSRIFDRPALNAFIALGPATWTRVRARLSELLRHDNPELRDNAALRRRAIVPLTRVVLHLPVEIPGYTDFYS